MLKGILILLFSIVSFHLFCQTSDRIIPTSEVSTLFNKYKEIHKESTTLKGWKIQILSSTNRRSMEKVRGEFMHFYPGYAIRSDFSNPYYILRVGTFETKNQAIPLFRELKDRFDQALLVVENIKKSDLIK
jgi:hypothetical protein